MSEDIAEDIVAELRDVARIVYREFHSVMGVNPDFEPETTVPWRAADEIASLRLSLKEAEASRDEIIEECAKIADKFGDGDVLGAASGMEIDIARSHVMNCADAIRRLKSSPSQSPKTEGEKI